MRDIELEGEELTIEGQFLRGLSEGENETEEKDLNHILNIYH